MIRVILTAFALLTFTGSPTPANPATATRGDGVAIVDFYIGSKGSGYQNGPVYLVIESADGNGFAVAEVVLGGVRGGQVIDVILIYSDAEFTGPPTCTVVGTGQGATVFAVMGE